MARLLFCAALLAAGREASAGAVEPPRRRAVLVGIDDYAIPNARRVSPGRTWPSLRGAVRDASLFREMLVARYGFRAKDIVTLQNQGATRAAILRAIRRHLVDPARKDDILLFFFAGHGTQVPNSLSAELDRMDEAIVPADAPLGVPDIRDKELSVLFNQALDRGARLTILLDSCHSGSGVRGLATDVRTRAVQPGHHDARDSASPPAPETRGALVLSATRDFASAYEKRGDDGNEHGAFSWALLRALRDATPGEAAEDTFLRAQARMRSESPLQEPVLSGDATARLTPFLGTRPGLAATSATVAVEQVASDSTVMLQGGWAHGLTVGTELRPLRGGTAAPRIRITRMLGIARSEGQLLAPARSATPPIRTGALLEIVAWAATPGRALRVWMPTTDDLEPALAFARRMKEDAERNGVSWNEDPTRETPTHVLRWREHNEWDLLRSVDASVERLVVSAVESTLASELPYVPKYGPSETSVQWGGGLSVVGDRLSAPSRATGGTPPTDNLKLTTRPTGHRLPGSCTKAMPTSAAGRTGRSLFVQLPASAQLIRELSIGPDGDHDAIELVSEPGEADFVLAGRWSATGLEYAWIRPAKSGAENSPIPARSDWHAPVPLRDAAIVLRHAILRLHKIAAWQELESPPDFHSPYRLTFARSDGSIVNDAIFTGGETYGLRLRAVDPATRPEPRFFYVFGVDSFGRSVLLFPLGGSVENRFPIAHDEASPHGIPIGSVTATAPYGLDTYVLLSTAEAIPNPSVLEWSGVRMRGPRGETALEEVLSRTGGAGRSATPVLTPAHWSIDRVFIQSVPPQPSRSLQ